MQFTKNITAADADLSLLINELINCQQHENIWIYREHGNDLVIEEILHIKINSQLS